MKKLIFPGVFAAIALSACSGGASGEKLIGSWTCDGPDRPNMEFKAGGSFTKTPSAIPIHDWQAGGLRLNRAGPTSSTATA